MIFRAVIYARCSTEEETQKDALTKQVQEAMECVRQKNWILVDSYVESRSGTSTKGRKEYTRLFEDIGKNKFDIIVIKSQDRLMRNTMDWYLFVNRLTSCGKKLYIYIEQKFYTQDDALVTGIKAILAEEYSRELSKKLNNAHRNRQKTGSTVLITNNAYGYKKLPDKSVIIVEEEAKVKRRMYELCAAGYGCRRISAILEKEGIYNRKGNPFHDADIRRMIRNPMNKGTVVMNRFHYDFDTKQIKKVPEEEQFVYKDRIPAIVSEELWKNANEEMDKRRHQKKQDKEERSNTTGRYLFSGKIYCGICGSVYYRTVRHKGEKKVCEWKCSQYLQRGLKGCSNVAVKEDILFEYLKNIQEQTTMPDQTHIEEVNIGLLKKTFQEEAADSEGCRVQARRQKLEKQMNTLVDKLLEGVISDSTYRMKIKDMENKIRLLEKNAESGQSEVFRSTEWEKRINDIRKYMKENQMFCKALAALHMKEIKKIVIWESYMEIILQDGSIIRKYFGDSFDYYRKKQAEREKIMGLIQENPGITAKQIADHMNISLSCANYRINKLKKEGSICFIGKGGKGKWKILHNNGHAE